jgi:ATP synthase subunit 6
MKSPLEQFKINNYINFFGLDINNSILYIFITIILTIIILKSIKIDYIIINNSFSYYFHFLFKLLFKQYSDVLTLFASYFIPFLISLFFFILFANLLALIPYSFAITSQIIITFVLSSTIILGITITGILKHGFKFINLFIPSGLPLLLLPLIFIIEIISYLSRIISLSVRLSANIISGHILLYILSSFGYKVGIVSSILLFIPFLFIFYFLELGVALIQAFVFTILTGTYIKDAILLH